MWAVTMMGSAQHTDRLTPSTHPTTPAPNPTAPIPHLVDRRLLALDVGVDDLLLHKVEVLLVERRRHGLARLLGRRLELQQLRLLLLGDLLVW